MIKDQLVSPRICITDIPHTDIFRHRQFLPHLISKGHIGFFSADFILQMISNTHKEWFKIRNIVDLIINAVYAGKQHQRCRRKCSQCLHHIIRIGAGQHHNQHITDHTDDTDGFNKQLRNIIIQAVFLHCIDITLATFYVFCHKILLFACNFYFFDPLHSLGNPFKQATVIRLIFLSGFSQDRF